jgi:hypothetical protein
VFRNRKPASAAIDVIAVAVAPENGALRKNRGLSSGSSRRDSYHKNPPRVTAVTANRPVIRAEPQPALGPSMIA